MHAQVGGDHGNELQRAKKGDLLDKADSRLYLA